MIKEISACNKMKFSSNVNEVIRAVLNFFLRKEFACTKAPKAQKHNEAKA